MAIIEVDEVMKYGALRARLPHEEKYERGAAYINGTFCSISDASIPLYDQGFVNCDVVYEKATIAKGRFFRLEDHFDRFAHSCAKFRLHNPCNNREMTDIFSELVRRTGLREAGLMWCVTRGVDSLEQETDVESKKGHCAFYAVADPYLSISSQEQRRRGLHVLISTKYVRIQPRAVDPKVKNFHWMDLKLSLFEARDQGMEWSLLTDGQGFLTEAPGANVFVVSHGELLTPEFGCLEGITRRSVLELAQELGLVARVTQVHVDELRAADDAFLTSSAGGIMPINAIDGVVLGGRSGPGEITTILHNLYWTRLWDGWKGTAVSPL